MCNSTKSETQRSYYLTKLVTARQYLAFDDVMILPRYSQIEPSHVSLDTYLTKRIKVHLPFVLAPMKSIFNLDLAMRIVELGGAAILPTDSVRDPAIALSNFKSRVIDEAVFPYASLDSLGRPLLGVALSVDKIDQTESLAKAGADFFVLETAHASHARVLAAVDDIRSRVDCDLIVGNVVTSDAAKRLADLGVQAVKVGIGQGSICTTSRVTGIGAPLLSAVAEVADTLAPLGIHVIADGGIRTSGDIVKSLAVGADAVCIGNLFARATEASGEVRAIDGIEHRQYSANPYRSLEFDGETGIRDVDDFLQSHSARSLWIEGASGWVPVVGPLHLIVMTLSRGIQGGLGYVGASTINELTIPSPIKASWTQSEPCECGPERSGA